MDFHTEHKRLVELVQIEQAAALECLAKWHKVDEVFSEGFAAGQEDAYEKRISQLDGDERLLFGAPAALLVSEKIRRVLPLENEAAHALANPLVGKAIAPDAEAIRAREKAMVQAVLSRGKFGVIVLGASHDLSAVVPADCDYWRLTVQSLGR